MTKSVLIAVSIVLGGSSLAAAARDSKFSATVGPLLKTYCVSCHGGSKPKADFALDALAPEFAKNGESWKSVADRLAEGSMPPKGKPRPTAAEQAAIVDWVAAGLSSYQAEQAAAQGRARLRRLNRIEYANTMRDLLGAEVDIEMLPEDGIASGFDNVDAALDLSSTLLERYLEAADAALDTALVKWAKPESTKWRVDMPTVARKISKTKRPMPRFGEAAIIRENEVVFFSHDKASKGLVETRVSNPGLYRFRISARAVNHGKGLTLVIYAGNYGYSVQGQTTRPISVRDVPDEQTVLEFTERMAAKESISISPYGMPNIHSAIPDNYDGPGLAIEWIDVEGPLVDTWPPAPTARLLGGVELAKATAADAETILRRFAPRAFRRPATDQELAPYLNLMKAQLDGGSSVEGALRVGLKAVLCSPDFLYMSARPGKLSDFDLATRLSYFLWSSAPDDKLAELAAAGRLSEPDALRGQVERMLDDPRAHAFTENFTGQWLSLRNLKMTIPDKKLYPDFDDLLELAMPQETRLFFERLLKDNRSALEFVQSDWSMLNERLARLYGVPDVRGSEFRKASLPPGSHRGGVLTQAAVLKVTANGTNTSPVVRGAWVLDHILGTPPPPPPKDVPAIEPDIRGTKTIREQLAKHRQIESCAACHAKIDPAGNALENFDVIGGWREFYRTTPEAGKTKVKIENARGKAVPVGEGAKVDAADALTDGYKFTDVDGFKRHVLENPDQFARGLAGKLLVYATGHALEFSDRETVEKIVAEIRPKKYAFRDMIHAVVQSPAFRSK